MGTHAAPRQSVNIRGQSHPRPTLAFIMQGVPAGQVQGKPQRVGFGTVRYERPDGSTVWRYRETDIVTRLPDGSYRLDSGGWRTHTTQAKINEFSPARLYTKNGIWYLGREHQVFFDGMKIDSHGFSLATERQHAIAERKALAAHKTVHRFVARVQHLSELPRPASGDCWFCSMRTQTGATLGEAGGMESDHAHLREHVKDGYIHGSLLLNAMKAARFTDMAIYYVFNETAEQAQQRHSWRTRLCRALRQYLGRAYGLNLR